MWLKPRGLIKDCILPAVNVRKLIWAFRLPYNHFKNSIDYGLI
jgi:hypothetical protein